MTDLSQSKIESFAISFVAQYNYYNDQIPNTRQQTNSYHLDFVEHVENFPALDNEILYLMNEKMPCIIHKTPCSC